MWIAFNTVIGNSVAGIITENWASGNGNVLAFNAIAPAPGVPVLQPATPVGTVTGNADLLTRNRIALTNRTTAPYDLWPVAAGPLIGTGGTATQPTPTWRPVNDFMGAPRGSAAEDGAFQRTGSGSGPDIGGGPPRPPIL